MCISDNIKQEQRFVFDWLMQSDFGIGW
jgi:hypothetical protein